jgi:hypothetical protein
MKASSILSTAARTAIASAYVAALNTAETNGSLVTHVCNVANKYTKGAALPDEDINAVVVDIAKAKGWKGASAKTRSSEVRTVLKAAHVLPDAIETATATHKRCDWHTSIRIARFINKGQTLPKSIKAAFEKSEGHKGTPEGRAAGALKAWFKLARGAKKQAILEAASILGLKLGVKLDA